MEDPRDMTWLLITLRKNRHKAESIFQDKNDIDMKILLCDYCNLSYFVKKKAKNIFVPFNQSLLSQ